MSLSIGQAADKSGCTPPTIRYYESIGLLPPPCRAATQGAGSYGRARRWRGLPSSGGRAISDWAYRRSAICWLQPRLLQRPASRRARSSRNTFARCAPNAAELKALEAALAAILVRCDEGCRGGNPGACAIFDDFHVPGAAST